MQLRMMVAAAEHDTAEGAVTAVVTAAGGATEILSEAAGAVRTITGELHGGSDDISAWIQCSCV